jgi:hypothetical protein
MRLLLIRLSFLPLSGIFFFLINHFNVFLFYNSIAIA